MQCQVSQLPFLAHVWEQFGEKTTFSKFSPVAAKHLTCDEKKLCLLLKSVEWVHIWGPLIWNNRNRETEKTKCSSGSPEWNKESQWYTAQPTRTPVKHNNFISHANRLPFLLLKFNIKNEKLLQPSATWKKMAIVIFQVCIWALQVNEFSTNIPANASLQKPFQEMKGCCPLKC